MSDIKNAAYVLSIAIVFSTLIFSFAMVEASKNITVAAGSGSVQAAGTVATATPYPTAAPTIAATAAPTATPKFNLAAVNGKPTRGSSSAPVTMVAFEDGQCPFCAQFFTNAETQIIQNYVNTNKVKLVWMNFPLDSIHPNARPSANALMCVFHDDGNDVFWKFHDILYQNNGVVNVGNVINDSYYSTWAQQAGADMTKFQSCYSSKKYDSEVTADENLGVANGVGGTPSFFIVNDATGATTNIVGAQPYSAFQPALDSAATG